jgi:hypothetical protein
MAETSYYKYAEQSANSQINWYQVGKDITDMISTEKKIREEKRNALDEGIRQDFEELANNPQGLQGDTSNKFVTDFAESMKQQAIIDNKLLKSGQMSVKDWTLRRQNKMDGTKNLFDLAKLYQGVYKDRMEKFNNGEIQALNAFNMSSIEGFADFSKSRGIIDPRDGTVNIGIMAPNPKTGIMELTKDVMPVGVARGKILAEIPTFKVYDALTKAEASLGTEVQSLYKAATLAGAGSITEFTDITKRKGFGEYAGVINMYEKAEDQMVDSFFTNPYNLSSVLTENTGKFSAESYTYDRDEAARDKSKILLKIDPNSKIPTLDKMAPHFSDQEKIARDWVKTQFRMKLDRKVEVKSDLSQTNRRDIPEWMSLKADEKKKLINNSNLLGHLYAGKNGADIQAASDQLKGLKDDKGNTILRVARGNRAVIVYKQPANGGEVTATEIPFRANDGSLKSQEQFIESAATTFFGDQDWRSAIKQGGYIKNGNFNDTEGLYIESVESPNYRSGAKGSKLAQQQTRGAAAGAGVMKPNQPASGQGWMNPNTTNPNSNKKTITW